MNLFRIVPKRSSGKWKSYWEIAHEVEVTISLQALASEVRPRSRLVPTLLSTLVKRGFVSSKPDDEGGRVYQITSTGEAHIKKKCAKRRPVSTFPPPSCRPGNCA